MNTTTQSKQILSHLEAGNEINPIEALNKFGCFRLGARIYDLKQQGYDITKRMVKVNDDAYVAFYSLKVAA